MSGLDENQIKASPLWNHIAKVLSHMVTARPVHPLQSLNSTSNYVMTGKAVPAKQPSVYAEVRPAAKSDVPADALTNTCWASNFGRSMVPLKPPRRPLNGEDEEDEREDPQIRLDEVAAEEATLMAGLSDVVTEQSLFNVLGAGLPPAEAYCLMMGMRQLVKSEPLATARFWGKILGSGDDYYVAETKIDPSRLPEDADDAEPEDDDEEVSMIGGVADVLCGYMAKKKHSVAPEEAGTGLNEVVYYAANTSDPTQWTRLPEVTPQQICAARHICNAFSGNLEAPVHSHPRFPGAEKHYLRAQVARITSTCSLAPRDIFTTEGALPDEEEDEDGNIIPSPAVVPAYSAIPPLIPQDIPDEEDEEAIQPIKAWFSGYADEELLQGRYWVHIAPTLLECGRVTIPPPPPEDQGENKADEEPDDDPADPEATAELINPFLSDVSKDAPMTFPSHSRANFAAWTFRQGFRNESNPNCVYLARSMRWPGAVNFALTTKGKSGAQYAMVYIGTGLKNLQGIDYAPQLPPPRLVEYPEDGLVMQRDYTVDEELEYSPMPARPDMDDEEEEEENEYN